MMRAYNVGICIAKKKKILTVATKDGNEAAAKVDSGKQRKD